MKKVCLVLPLLLGFLSPLFSQADPRDTLEIPLNVHEVIKSPSAIVRLFSLIDAL